ncbi:MAG TPA: copper oxidase, partial [Bdellovibrionales bacterium]|nr:copper oxidase [Bdellovibrionales bacterium]
MNFIRIFGVGLVVLLWGFAGQAKVVEYKLVIAEGSVQVEGQTFSQKIMVNGSIPGPELTFHEGDTARITVLNQTSGKTLLH